MLTIRDLDEIEKLFEKKLDEKLKHVPSTELFLSWMDKLMGELKTTREEHIILDERVSIHSDQLADHDSRLLKLELKKHPQ